MKTLPRDEGLEPTSPLWGERRSRYHLAAPLVFAARVLDVSCDSGFGARILAEAGADEVLAINVSFATLDPSITNDRPILLLQSISRQLPLKDDVVDIAVSFETIEHIDDPNGFVGAIRDALRSGGTLLISAPNRNFTDRLKGTGASPDVRRYTPEEFMDLLSSHFAHVELHGQHVHPRYPVCPYWQLPQTLGDSPLTRLRILSWKLQNRMPFKIKDTLSRLIRNRSFYPGEFDFVLTDDLQDAHVLIGRCTK